MSSSLSSLDSRKGELEKMLTDSAVYEEANKAHLKLLLEEQAEIQIQIKKTEEDWLSKNEKLQEIV